MEDAIYDSYAMRKFMGVDFLEEQVPDATTLLHFRHLLQKHKLNAQMFHAIEQLLTRHGHIMKGGTIVDATIIAAPSSTKNETKARDPEMSATKKGSQWHFGMKAHIGVDAGTGYVTSVESTSANVHDVTVASRLLRKDDMVVYGDSGYLGIEKRGEIATDPCFSTIDYRINRRPGRAYRDVQNNGQNWERIIERQKSSVRSKVEHPFRFVKRQFGYVKTAYRGIAKNHERLCILFASANLLMLAKAGRSLVPS